MDDFIKRKNIERFEMLLATDLDPAARTTVMKLLQLEHAKRRFLPGGDT